MTSPAATGSGRDLPARSWLDTLATPVTVIALLGYPLTLTSPGATIAMILVGLYGLAFALRDGLPTDLRLVHRSMLACYLLLLVVDVVNGSILQSLLSTGVNYLPLLALAPYANALRRLSLSPRTFDRAMMATVVIATASSGFGMFVLDEYRPGGINIGSIPYSFVVAVWGTFLLSQGLGRQAPYWSFLIGSVLALVTVVLGQSKTVAICAVVGYLVVGIQWAYETRRFSVLITGAVVGGGATIGLFSFVALARIDELIYQLQSFFVYGSVNRGTFGDRYELVASGLRAFWDRPFLGYGLQERMGAVIEHLKHTDIGVQTLGHLHNDYITHMVSFGVFGLVFLVAWIVLTYRLVVRSGDMAYQRAAIALLAMLMVYMTAEVAFNMDPISSVVTLALGMVLARGRDPLGPTPVRPAIDGKST